MKEYNRIGLLLAGILVVLATMLVSVQPVMSASENATAVAATVTVSSDIDVTMNVSMLLFGPLDPGIINSSATNGPINVTIHGTTNKATNLSIKGLDFDKSGDTIAIGNVSYSNESAGSYPVMTNSYGDGSFADWQSIPDPAVDVYRAIYARISIPSGQVGGVYNSTMTIRVQEE